MNYIHFECSVFSEDRHKIGDVDANGRPSKIGWSSKEVFDGDQFEFSFALGKEKLRNVVANPQFQKEIGALLKKYIELEKKKEP